MDPSTPEPPLPAPAIPGTSADPGQLIHVAEADYRYATGCGTGRLRLWVESAGPPFVWHDGDLWRQVCGRAYTATARLPGQASAVVRLCGVRWVRLGFDGAGQGLDPDGEGSSHR